ncbi:MAG: hypothetical protein JNL97_06365, partial [Verrucomicrobiales bacterium]|nr:hypothetical protein [Verrucomicrobiales bacterium]
DVRWHPLNLLNTGAEGTISVSPEVVGREVTLAVYRKVPSPQLVGAEPVPDAYVLEGRASSSGASPAEVALKAPSGSTLGEQEYVAVVAPKDFATAAAGYRVELKARTALLVPASLSAAEVSGASAFVLRPTPNAGEAEAQFENQPATEAAPRYHTFRAAADGTAVIRVEADFDAVVALYSQNRGLIEVATQVRQGVVTLRATVESGALYYVRVANGDGTSPREGSKFDIDLQLPTAPRLLGLSLPNGGGVAVDTGGFTIGASNLSPPSFFTIQPAVGFDVVMVKASAPGNGAVRISAASVDGFWERSFATGETAVMLVPVRTQGTPVQIAVASSASFGTLFYYGGLSLPRELAIGTLSGQRLSPAEGRASLAATGFDRAGDRAGFEFYQGVVPAGRIATWTAEGSGGATPVLLRYETRGSVLSLVDWTLPDPTAKATMQFQVRPESLYAIAAHQVTFVNGGSVKLSVDHPEPIPVGVGMVPDLAYEQQNQGAGRYRYILQIRGVTLERAYEEDYWETLLPERFFEGNPIEDPAMPVLEVAPDSPGSALRLSVQVLDGDGDPLQRWNGDPVLPFRSGPDGTIRVDFATLGVFRQSLIGKKLQFRVWANDGALGDGTYTLRMTVRTPNPNPYMITEKRWDYPGPGVIPPQIKDVATFPADTAAIDIPQNPAGEGSMDGAFLTSAVGVRLYRFWTPSSGPFRVWTEGITDNPANTTIKLYRARYAVTEEGERNSWWETIDYLEELNEIGPSLDWYPADRSEIDALVMIQDPEFPAYKQPTNRLAHSTEGNPPESALDTPYLPADRQFSDKQDVYFVVVKNELGSTGRYRVHVSTEDLPHFRDDPIYLPQFSNAPQNRSVIAVDVPEVERYGNRIGVFDVQMPEKHSGYLGISGQSGADWKFAVYGPDGKELALAVEANGESRFLVPLGGGLVRVKVLETGKNTVSNNAITLAATLTADAGLPSHFETLGLGNLARTLLPTNPWGELKPGDFTGSAPVDSAGRLFRFRAPTGPVEVEVAPLAGSTASFLWGIYDDGRLLAWDLAVPGQPATYRTTIVAGTADATSLAGSGRNLVLVVRHASASVQPAQFGITIDPAGAGGFVAADPDRTSVPLPTLAFEASVPLQVQGGTRLIDGRENYPDWHSDQWIRFAVPDGPGQVVQLVDLPASQNVYPLRYDVYDASGRELVVSGIKTFGGASDTIDLPQLEDGKAYVVRLAPRDQPLGENLPVHVRFRPAKAAQSNGQYVYTVPSDEPDRPASFERVNSDYRGDFVLDASLAGKTSAWWLVDVPRSGPAVLEALVKDSTGVAIAIYRDDGSGEFPDVSLVDFVNESSDELTPDGKRFELQTFLGSGRHFIRVQRSNITQGEVRLSFKGPEHPVERLTIDPNQGVVLRAEMGRATPAGFFEVIAPVGSYGPASFLALDLDLADGRAQKTGVPPNETTVELTVRARIVVWAVAQAANGGVTTVLVRTLGREPEVDKDEPIKALLETSGKAQPFQRYIIGIQYEGLAPGYVAENSGRSKSIGVQAVFQVPNSGTPDLTVESVRLLPNNGQTLVEVTVLNRGF